MAREREREREKERERERERELCTASVTWWCWCWYIYIYIYIYIYWQEAMSNWFWSRWRTPTGSMSGTEWKSCNFLTIYNSMFDRHMTFDLKDVTPCLLALEMGKDSKRPTVCTQETEQLKTPRCKWIKQWILEHHRLYLLSVFSIEHIVCLCPRGSAY